MLWKHERSPLSPGCGRSVGVGEAVKDAGRGRLYQNTGDLLHLLQFGQVLCIQKPLKSSNFQENSHGGWAAGKDAN